MRRALIWGLAFSLNSWPAFSQNQPSCPQTLRLAQSTYDQGRLHEIPTILKECLNSSDGFTKQEKVNAYRILTNTYIYLEEPQSADSTMLKLLETDHYFEPNNAVDPAEFVALWKTFRTREIYRLGVVGGPNATQPNVVSSNSSSTGTASYSKEYGFQVGVSAEIPITDKLTLNPALLYSAKSFTYSQKGDVGTPDTIFDITSLEKQKWVSLPVALQYRWTDGKVNPYVSLGASFDYLLSASEAPFKSREKYQDVKQESISVIDQRKKFNMGIIASTGIKYEITGGYLVAEVRFQYGLMALNDESMIYENPIIFNNYNFVDGIFKLNTLSFSVGYVYNVFSPKKK